MSQPACTRIARRIATTFAIATMAFVGTAATALAATPAPPQSPEVQSDPPPATNPTIARANQIMSMDYAAFGRLSKNEPPFNWSSDHCSTPWSPGTPILGDFNDDFERACDQHDFGYANYGIGGLELSPNEGTRAWIDDRLQQEMRRICNNEVPFLDIPLCHTFATAFYGAVRTFGRGPFYS
jgi:hypothetical protein